jgi:hypothetical protein
MTPEQISSQWLREQLAQAPPPTAAQLALLRRLFDNEQQGGAA